MKQIQIHLEDLEDHFNDEQGQRFVQRVKINTKRYIHLFSQAIDKLMPEPIKQLDEDDETVMDVFLTQRQQNVTNNMQRNMESGITEPEQNYDLPPELKRRYELHILPGPNAKKKYTNMRNIKSENIGNLVNFKGIVTRASDIKPSAEVVTYSCESCGYEAYQTITGREFNPLIDCPSKKCRENKVKGNLFMQNRGSKFSCYQELKIQEPAD